jgi:hypothetical protein
MVNLNGEFFSLVSFPEILYCKENQARSFQYLLYVHVMRDVIYVPGKDKFVTFCAA